MRAAWLTMVMLAACGGRSLDAEGIAEGSGGDAAVPHGDGGAPSLGGAVGVGGAFTLGGAQGKGGAFTSGGVFSMGGALTSGGVFGMGGALTSGGAQGKGGATGVTDEITLKSCEGYCIAAADTCTLPSGQSVQGCTAGCIAEAKRRGSRCQQDMVALLSCARISLGSGPHACLDFPWAISGPCSDKVELVRQCGLSLPGAQSCMTVFSGTDDACTRVSRCGATKFEAFCKVDRAGVGFVSCACQVDDVLAFGSGWQGDPNFSCGVAAVGMVCGPDLEFPKVAQ